MFIHHTYSHISGLFNIGKPHLWLTSPGIVKPHQVSGVHTAQHGSPVE